LIPVIDIFAGPGGLGEGFCSVLTRRGDPAFGIQLSIEMNEFAHATLRLRTFYRLFQHDLVPADYYDHLRGRITLKELYGRHPEQARQARQKAWKATLGKTSLARIRVRIEAALRRQAHANHWVLIGGPPCQAYSIAGRSRNAGVEDYDPATDRRQWLYLEYLQIIADHWPAVFVIENVKGLLSATLKSQRMFQRVVADLFQPELAIRRENRPIRHGRTHHYHIWSLVQPGLFANGDLEGSVVRAELYGIPQARHRVILVGVRDDLGGVMPGQLEQQTQVPISRVIHGLPALRSGLSRVRDSDEAWVAAFAGQADRRWFNDGTRRAAGEDLRNRIRAALREITAPRHGRGGEFIEADAPVDYRPRWYADGRLNGVCNHSSRAHIEQDLYRYLYAACFAQQYRRSPTLSEFPTELLPDHANVQTALDEGGYFSDRFRVQVASRPATTITAHISKDGHYYIHPDPLQCRALTIREAARIQTFPDNYFFEGPRTAQYVQVGNAVPPLLARQKFRSAALAA
jgi:DNA (cytosine-5)-methyltransferase 1